MARCAPRAPHEESELLAQTQLDQWVAVRHADDHVHVVATLARRDGRRVFPRNDFYRAGEASRAVEAAYGLPVTAASDRTAAKRVTYAETAKAVRRGQGEPVRDTLRRSVCTATAGATTMTSSWSGCATTACWSGSGTAPALPGAVQRPPRRACRSG